MLVWNDIAKYTKDYNNGIKKLDDVLIDAKILQNEKLNHKTNKFKLHSLTDDYGLDDKITIRTMKFKYDNGLKNIFDGKSIPGNSLKGKTELSSGTKEVINMTNKMIPKIDHSYIDPGYYEHKLEGKTNNDLMLKNMSGKEFAKNYVSDIMNKKTPEQNDLQIEPLSKRSINNFKNIINEHRQDPEQLLNENAQIAMSNASKLEDNINQDMTLINKGKKPTPAKTHIKNDTIKSKTVELKTPSNLFDELPNFDDTIDTETTKKQHKTGFGMNHNQGLEIKSAITTPTKHKKIFLEDFTSSPSPQKNNNNESIELKNPNEESTKQVIDNVINTLKNMVDAFPKGERKNASLTPQQKNDIAEVLSKHNLLDALSPESLKVSTIRNRLNEFKNK